MRDSYFPTLDAFRAVGATMVVATHVGFNTGRYVDGPFAATLARLDVGVAIFFVLSGFLLFRPYAVAAFDRQRAPRAPGYLWRRALRILPAYWIAAFTALVVLEGNRSAGLGATDWLQHLTLTQIYQFGDLRLGINQAWSLATEVAFYLVLPPLAALMLGRARVFSLGRVQLWVTVLWAANVTWYLLLGTTDLVDRRVAVMWLPAYLSWFSTGMLLAAISAWLSSPSRTTRWQVLDRLARAPWTCWAAALGLFLVATTPLAGPRGLGDLTTGQLITKNILYAGVAAFLLVPGMFGDRTSGPLRCFASRPARWLGEVSYGIFLWHQLTMVPAMWLLDRPPFTGGFVVVFTLTWPLAVLAAAASYFVIEQPVMRLRGRVPR